MLGMVAYLVGFDAGANRDPGGFLKTGITKTTSSRMPEKFRGNTMKNLQATLFASAALLSVTLPAGASDACRELSLGRSEKPMELASRESEGLVRQWISGTLPTVLNFRFVDKSMEKPCFFSDKGWEDFKSKFDIPAYEKNVKDNQTINNAVLRQPAIIKARGFLESGQYGLLASVTLIPWGESVTEHTMGTPFSAEYTLLQYQDENGDNFIRVAAVK